MFNIFRELSASLNLTFGTYQIGIKRDPSNKQVFRRVSDGAQVELDGWVPGYPMSNDSHDCLIWMSSENTILNVPNANIRRFICEY